MLFLNVKLYVHDCDGKKSQATDTNKINNVYKKLIDIINVL